MRCPLKSSFVLRFVNRRVCRRLASVFILGIVSRQRGQRENKSSWTRSAAKNKIPVERWCVFFTLFWFLSNFPSFGARLSRVTRSSTLSFRRAGNSNYHKYFIVISECNTTERVQFALQLRHAFLLSPRFLKTHVRAFLLFLSLSDFPLQFKIKFVI